MVYDSLEQARTQILRSHVVPDADQARMVMEYLAENLEFKDGCYTRAKNTHWTLVSWVK